VKVVFPKVETVPRTLAPGGMACIYDLGCDFFLRVEPVFGEHSLEWRCQLRESLAPFRGVEGCEIDEYGRGPLADVLRYGTPWIRYRTLGEAGQANADGVIKSLKRVAAALEKAEEAWILTRV